MSKDSSHTYIHFHAPHHADLFEEFTHPPSSTSTQSANLNGQQPTSTADPTDPDLTHIPGHFLPFESIHLPQHLMPVNPEDEDGVVPDMHAAFGIERAMGRGMTMGPLVQGERSGRGELGSARVELVWSDLGVERLIEGVSGLGVSGEGRGIGNGAGVGDGVRREGVNGVRREGRRGGILSLR